MFLGAEMTKVSQRVQRRLKDLAADHAAVCGSEFSHFYCPIVYRDDETDLCEAHIINQAFGVSNLWTVQRKDVDNFFGSMFESEFIALAHRPKDIFDAISDPEKAKRFKPTLVLDGKEIPHYFPKGAIPANHSRLLLDGPYGETQLALKLPPEQLGELTASRLVLGFEKDLRLPAMVSSLKAAHLTLFSLLGYRHVFSAGGRFLGNTILGKFFQDNVGLPKVDVLRNARSHFAEFQHLIRPMMGVNETFRGTAEEGAMYICEQGSIRWGLVVLLRTGPGPIHAVLTPVIEEPTAAKIFLDFLRDPVEREIQMRLAWFRGDKWEAATTTTASLWPKAGPLLSDPVA